MNQIRYVNITIYDIPASLLSEFSEKVVKPYYAGGISQAIKDIMRKAVKYKKEKVRSAF